ncbi:MAG: DAK2 domain-containing protein [Eubacterium sp.]|nr:DAK2 domain-containing protein [Eubacterium sp.]
MSVEALKIANMFTEAAQNILDHAADLTKLDCELGDGDHGTTMEKIARVVLEAAGGWNEATDMKAALEDLNDTLEDVSGGSAAPLFGAFVCGMADAADTSQDTGLFTKTILLGAYEEFFDTSGAKPGGKSMMDAIYPATEVIRGCDTVDKAVLEKAAQAAREGSDATADMLGKYGRARYIGDRAIGHKDPGSVSFALFYEGLARGCDF